MPEVFVVRGDLTDLAADAIAFSADQSLGRTGEMYDAFARRVPGFARAYASLADRHRGRRLPPGTCFWLPLRQRLGPRGVAVVVSSGDRRSGAAAVEAALELARGRLAEPRPGDLPGLVALPAFLTGGGGRWLDRAAAAEAQLTAAARFLESRPGFDVAFVAYTDAAHLALLQVRRRLGLAPRGIEPPAPLVHAVRARECVLFVGSGVSMGSGLPSWEELIARIEAELGLEHDPARRDLDHYLDVAEWLREARGEQVLVELIRRGVSSRSAHPTLSHCLLASLPCPYTVTTNWDDLLERAFAAQHQRPLPIVHERDVALTGHRLGRYLVKPHGDAETARRGEGSLVLGRDDYEDYFRRRPAMTALIESLLLNQTFFFVGYGLRDLDFRLVFSRISSILGGARRPAYATTFGASPHQGRQWRRKQLHLLEMPGSTLAERARRLLALLDRLTEEALLDPHHILSEGSPRGTRALESMRAHLMRLGEQVSQSCRRGLVAGEALALASTLHFLVDLGWSPRTARGPRLHELYLRLADALPEHPEERRRLLAGALTAAPTLRDARILQRMLAAMESPPSEAARRARRLEEARAPRP